MSYTYDYLVFIGRFQPFHNGHRWVVSNALKHAKRVIICVGSASGARRPYNPFTFLERQFMIRESVSSISPTTIDRIDILPINDHKYNDDAWIAEVQSSVDGLIRSQNNPNSKVTLMGDRDFKVGLIGHAKDNTSYYLNKFPHWSSMNVDSFGDISAVNIRNNFLKLNPTEYGANCPKEVVSFLRKFETTTPFEWLVNYKKACDDYRKDMCGHTKWEKAVLCADNVVTQSGHILLIKRKSHPGEGQWALPGGHVHVDTETFKDAAIRELREETHISDKRGELPPGMLASFIKNQHVFDDPYRSERDRVVTVAFHYKIPDNLPMMKVDGDDDASAARWVKFSDVKENEMFEDHFHLISFFLGLK